MNSVIPSTFKMRARASSSLVKARTTSAAKSGAKAAVTLGTRHQKSMSGMPKLRANNRRGAAAKGNAVKPTAGGGDLKLPTYRSNKPSDFDQAEWNQALVKQRELYAPTEPAAAGKVPTMGGGGQQMNNLYGGRDLKLPTYRSNKPSDFDQAEWNQALVEQRELYAPTEPAAVDDPLSVPPKAVAKEAAVAKVHIVQKIKRADVESYLLDDSISYNSYLVRKSTTKEDVYFLDYKSQAGVDEPEVKNIKIEGEPTDENIIKAMERRGKEEGITIKLNPLTSEKFNIARERVDAKAKAKEKVGPKDQIKEYIKEYNDPPKDAKITNDMIQRHIDYMNVRSDTAKKMLPELEKQQGGEAFLYTPTKLKEENQSDYEVRIQKWKEEELFNHILEIDEELAELRIEKGGSIVESLPGKRGSIEQIDQKRLEELIKKMKQDPNSDDVAAQVKILQESFENRIKKLDEIIDKLKEDEFIPTTDTTIKVNVIEIFKFNLKNYAAGFKTALAKDPEFRLEWLEIMAKGTEGFTGSNKKAKKVKKLRRLRRKKHKKIL